jgi:hypothetical protein
VLFSVRYAGNMQIFSGCGCLGYAWVVVWVMLG